jgi:CRISPR-associated protein Csm2
MNEQIRSFIQSDSSTKQMVSFAESLGKKMGKKVSSSQIRNAYGTVKKIQMQSKFNERSYRELLLLKPKLAYARSRPGNKNNQGFEELEQALSSAIDAVDVQHPETFKRFCNFFEAILAYHKAHGGN